MSLRRRKSTTMRATTQRKTRVIQRRTKVTNIISQIHLLRGGRSLGRIGNCGWTQNLPIQTVL
jgi:hypothetical protein